MSLVEPSVPLGTSPGLLLPKLDQSLSALIAFCDLTNAANAAGAAESRSLISFFFAEPTPSASSSSSVSSKQENRLASPAAIAATISCDASSAEMHFHWSIERSSFWSMPQRVPAVLNQRY